MKNREVDDKYKGFRLQKLRLLERMLSELKINSQVKLIGALEYKDDVYLSKNNTEINEQNKDYTSNFSFNSKEITKSIINFLDNYIEGNQDENIKFCFYTNTNIAKEIQTKFLTDINLKPLKDPILEDLKNKNITPEVISFVKKFIIAKYTKTYANYKKENLKTIESLTDDEWKKFLLCIEFKFGEPDHKKLEISVSEAIKNSDFCQTGHFNKIDILKGYLLDEMDQKMTQENPFFKMISSNDIELAYLKVLDSPTNKKIDPLHENWEEYYESDKEDIRTIDEKILSVSPSFDIKILKSLKREAINSICELDSLDTKFSSALKVRVYNCMEDYFNTKFDYRKYEGNELELEIDKLKEEAIKCIKELRKDYEYMLENEISIKQIVVQLINECFHSFD